MTTRSLDRELLANLRALVHLSTADLLYADQYLSRAEVLLPRVCTREQYRALRHDHVSLPHLTAALRQATEQGDWPKVRTLAEQAANVRERVAASSQILPLADAVHGPRLLRVDATTLALSGVVAQADQNLSQARDATLEQLRTLASQDKEWASFYQSRLAYFEHCQLVNGEHAGPVVDVAHVRQQILMAIAAGEFARVARLTDSIAPEHGVPVARLRAPLPREERVRGLAAGLPGAAVARAGEVGLALETLPRVGGLNEYLSCGCADRATFPDTPLTETRRSAPHCTCGHTCPPEVRPTLRENLDVLIGHPFISSAGLRYLPWFGPETVLVEAFPETDPDARSGLLSALGLPKRRGLARDAMAEEGKPMNTSRGVLLGVILGVTTITVAAAFSESRAIEFLAVLLFGIGAVYGGFAIAAGGSGELLIETAAFVPTAVLTFLGLWVAPAWLAVGYFAHGAWDVVHHSHAKLVKTEVPNWYAGGCAAYDWLVGAFILMWWP